MSIATDLYSASKHMDASDFHSILYNYSTKVLKEHQRLIRHFKNGDPTIEMDVYIFKDDSSIKLISCKNKNTIEVLED